MPSRVSHRARRTVLTKPRDTPGGRRRLPGRGSFGKGNAMSNGKAVDVTIVGGGMITHDLILPSIYHLQRVGVVGEIQICALNSRPLKTLVESPDIRQAFPGQDFVAYPSLDVVTRYYNAD